MAGASLLTLIDDIASLLDDIATMTKVAGKKTAGVLGDDLALNAQQVSGIHADRELPVVWAVARGSLLNKAILVPAALLISILIPWAITPLLMFGGAFLCYEGMEKIIHSKQHRQQHAAMPAPLDSDIDLNREALEKTRIRGAIRTDFILSAEIIVIALGTVQQVGLLQQSLVLISIALLMTVGVYGLVAGIVKLDDAGLHLLQRGAQNPVYRLLGRALLASAPKLMRFLSVAGTVAMFSVGGSILWHGFPFSHTIDATLHHALSQLGLTDWQLLATIVLEIGAGLLAGLLLVWLQGGWQKARLLATR